MKNGASAFFKQIISAITTVAKAKTLELKSKTSAIKTRLIIFSLLRNKKMMMSSISDKLHALIGQQEKQKLEEDKDEKGKGIVVYSAMSRESFPNQTHTEFLENAADDLDNDYGNFADGLDDNDKYPDLTHSPFKSADLDFEDPGGSVIDLVKNSKAEGEEFRLEDEIDQVADLFIRRFHRQIRIQKQLSFKRHQEMLERSA